MLADELSTSLDRIVESMTAKRELEPSLQFPSSRAKLRAQSALASAGDTSSPLFGGASTIRPVFTPAPQLTKAIPLAGPRLRPISSKVAKEVVSGQPYPAEGNIDTNVQLKAAEATLKEISAVFILEKEGLLHSGDKAQGTSHSAAGGTAVKDSHEGSPNRSRRHHNHSNSSTTDGRSVRLELSTTADGRQQPLQSLYQGVMRASSAIAKSSRTPAGLMKVDTETNRPSSTLHHTTKRMQQLLIGGGDEDGPVAQRGTSSYLDGSKAALATRLLDSVFAPSATQPSALVRKAGDEAMRLASASHTRKAAVSEQTGLTIAPVNSNVSLASLNLSSIGQTPSRQGIGQPLDASRPNSSSNSKARGGRMAQIRTTMLVEAHGVKEQADRSRSRGNVLNNILALINDDPQAKAEVAERAKSIQQSRYGRAFSANTLQLPPGLAAIIQAKKQAAAEQAGGSVTKKAMPTANISDDDEGSAHRTNWMAHNAQRAKLYQHLVDADRVRSRDVEQDRTERALLSREEQHQDRLEALGREGETVRGLGKSASHRWATFVTIVCSASRIKQLIEHEKRRHADTTQSQQQITNDTAQTSDADGMRAFTVSEKLVALVNQLQGLPRFKLAVDRFIRQRRHVAAYRIHSFLLTVRSASKIQMRCRQLLAHIRLMQRSVRKFLLKRRAERELWCVLVQHLTDERVAFTRQITIDYEKEHKRRRLALTSASGGGTTGKVSQQSQQQPQPAGNHFESAMATDAAALLIQLHGGGEGPGIGGSVPQVKGGRSIQSAMLAVRSLMDSSSTTSPTTSTIRKAPIPLAGDNRGRSGLDSSKAEEGRGAMLRRNGHTGVPHLVVSEAMRVLTDRVTSMAGASKQPSATSVAVDQDTAITTATKSIVKVPGQPNITVHHSRALNHRYATLAVQQQVEIMRARHEQLTMRIPAEGLFAISCMPAAVARFWRDIQLAVFFSKATFDLPHAERMTIRLPLKYRDRLVDYFRERELAVYHQQVGKWRAVYKNAKAKYDWERELAAHELKRAKAVGATMDVPAVLNIKIDAYLPPFPTRRHLPNATEARFIVMVGYAIQFLEKKALAEAHIAVAERASLKTIEGRAMLEHEKLQIATRVLSFESINEVFEKVIQPFARQLPDITGPFATGRMVEE